ncbi:MAG: hypothetical protein V4509_01910 [Patescibacteria group bacterium]
MSFSPKDMGLSQDPAESKRPESYDLYFKDTVDQPNGIQEIQKPESYDQYFGNKEEPSFIERWKNKPIAPKDTVKNMKRHLQRTGISAGTGVAGGYGDLASLIIGENPFTSKELRNKSFELLPSLAPQSDKEKEWDEGISTISGFFTPFGPLKGAGKVVGKGFEKLTPFLKGKYKELYEIGKGLGISEQALAPFRHGKVSETFLKHISKLGEKATEGIKFAQKLASPTYDKLYEMGAKIPVNQITKRSVVRGLENVIQDIQKSPALVNESKDVIKFLNESIDGIMTNPNLNVENLMALQKQLGKTVNWNSIKQAGKGHLIGKSKDAVMAGVYGMDPSLGRKFDSMDKLYSGYKSLAKEVSPNKIVEFASKGGPVGYALVSLLTGHDLEDALKTGLGTYFGKKALGNISGNLLTNPKWVGIKEKVIQTIKNESFDKIPKLLIALKKKSDEDQSNPMEQ